MSTYDAYNLSLRDSTEFTVPTGGGSDGNITIYKVKIKATQGSGSGLYQSPVINVPYIFDEDLARDVYANLPEEQLNELISVLPKIDYDCGVNPDGQWHEYKVLGINGVVYFVIDAYGENATETLITNMSENVEKIVSSGHYLAHKIIGDAFIELEI